MISILRKILMVQDETIRCPYWEQGKCTAVDIGNSTNSQTFGTKVPSGYPLNCNYQAGFIQCSKYLEVRVKEIESRDNSQQKVTNNVPKGNLNLLSTDTHTLLGKVIPKNTLQTNLQSQEEAKLRATGGRT